jgi:hypothetical protein
MYPEPKDTDVLDSVDDKNKGPVSLADDITKRVANRKLEDLAPVEENATSTGQSTTTPFTEPFLDFPLRPPRYREAHDSIEQ